MQISAPLSLLVLSPLAFAPGADGPAWAPADGAQLTKEFVTTSTVQLDSMVMDRGGQTMENEGVEVEVEVTNRVTYTDGYSSVEGTVSQIAREFGAIRRALDVSVIDNDEEHPYESEAEHGLAGHTVEFTRGEDGWTAAYPEGDDGKTEWLEGLTAEADLATLLSKEDAEEGDSWSLDAEALMNVLRPAGTPIPFHEEMPDGADNEGAAFGPFFDPCVACEKISGEAEVTWRSTEERDGARYALLALELDIDAEADVTDSLNELVASIGATGQGMPEFTEILLTAGWEAEGTLTWNLTTGLPESLSLEGPCEMLFDLMLDDGGMEMSVTLTLSGDTQVELSTTTP